MTKFNVEPKITAFTITIESPMHRPVELFKGRDIPQWETIFINLRNNEQNSVYKRNYDICRAILQYAYSCWGSLKEVSNGLSTLIFTFSFDPIDGLTVFERDLKKVVEKCQ